MSRIDSLYSANVTIDGTHHLTHKGVVFDTSVYNAALANNASADILIRTTNAIHIVAEATVSGDTEVLFYEAATFSAAGASAPCLNKNRISTKTTTALFTTGPTITGTGTMLGHYFIPGGSKNGATGASASEMHEFILAPNQTYLIRATNISGSAIKLGVLTTFYEIALL